MPAESYFLYAVQAYNQGTPDATVLKDVATVGVFADTEKEALKKARTLVKKNYYRISQVTQFWYDKRFEGSKE